MLALHGHVWTIAPYLQHLLRPSAPPPSEHWRVTIDDRQLGPVRLTGRMRHRRDTDTLVLVVHGLGGFSGSHYVVEAARAVEAMGFACLRLNLRGADRRGEDYYHAGLSDDLHAVLACPSLARYGRVLLLGYSLGGHLSLRYAALGPDRRVAAVAAVCPPVDLAASAAEIDRPERGLYRKHVLRGLKDMYRGVARRGRPVPMTPERADRIRTMREWDEHVVAPRHGFDGAEHYWASASVAPVLSRIAVPALVLAARRDPMVLERSVRPALERATAVRTVWLDRGGHVGFPQDADPGLGPGGGVLPQTLAWLADPG